MHEGLARRHGEFGARTRPGSGAKLIAAGLLCRLNLAAFSKPNSARSSLTTVPWGIYDDRGNRMSPSYSTKNGIRYRFYVSSALPLVRLGRPRRARPSRWRPPRHVLDSSCTGVEPPPRSGRHSQFPPRKRVPTIRPRLFVPGQYASRHSATLPTTKRLRKLEFQGRLRPKNLAGSVDYGENVGARDEGLVQSIVRAHAWNQALLTGTHASVEKLAEANGLLPKIVRQALRLAFLSPEVTSAILEGGQPSGLVGANSEATCFTVGRPSTHARLIIATIKNQFVP
jgi:hypothetical protein